MTAAPIDVAMGLTSEEARRRLAANGTNAVLDVVQRPINRSLRGRRMVTDDAPVTARVVADPVGIAGPLCSTAPLPRDIRAEDFAVFAGVMPEDKYALVQALQRAGHIAVVFGAAIVLAFCLDTVKVFLFRRLAIA